MAFDPFGDSESLLEQGKSLVKSAGDQTAKQVKTTVQTVKQQTGSQTSQQPNPQAAPQASSQQTQEFIQDLYGANPKQPVVNDTKKSSPSQQQQPAGVKQQLGLEKEDLSKKASTVAGQLGLDNDNASKTASVSQQLGLDPLKIPKTPEEVAKMQKARQELQQMHDSTYYKPTFVDKPKIEEQKEEQEKNQEEQQKEQERMQLEEQKKKEPPIALQNAKNKIEMNRGASG